MTQPHVVCVQCLSLHVQLKHELEALRADLLPKVASWASHGACSAHFLSCFTSDLQEVEEEARSKVVIPRNISNTVLFIDCSARPSDCILCAEPRAAVAAERALQCLRCSSEPAGLAGGEDRCSGQTHDCPATQSCAGDTAAPAKI